MLKIIRVNNTFDASKDREIKEVEWQGKPLSFYTVPLVDPIVYVNQKRIEDLDYIPYDKSEIIISPKQKIEALVPGLQALFSAAFVTGAASGYLAVGLSYVVAGAVVMAGSSLLSSILAPQIPNYASSSIEESPTYSWNTAKTLARMGSPIPVLYGRHRVSGSIIQRKIDYVGDDEYLNLQLALCMGEIKEIYDGNILINNTPITEYEDVEWFWRKGSLTQDLIPYFSDIETPNSFDVNIEDIAIVRDTIGNANEAIRLFIQFPNGMYYQNDSGGLDSREVELKIEYRVKGATDWVLLQQEDSRFGYWEYRCGTEHFDDTAGDNGLWSCGSPYTWKTTQGDCYTGNKRAVYNTNTFDTWKFEAAQTTSFSREIRIPNLTPDQYEVQITRITPVSDDVREQTTCHWVGMGEIITDDLTYPTVALLGFRIKATGQLSGEVNVLVDVEREDIEVFDEDGVSQGLKSLNNPAWVFWDVLTNPLYGYSLEYSNIDFDAIQDWADWCDELVPAQIEDWVEPRYRFDGVFDFEGNVWDSLVKVATVGRATPIIRGTKYSVIVDKPAQMTQIFNMGNIVKGSLKISYIAQEDLANEVEVQFTNKDKDYTNDTLSIVVPEWFSTDLQVKKTTINQMGTARATQAYRIGRYFLNNNRNVRRTAEFDVGLDALDSEVGDVAGISHDVPAWGQSGRLVGATTNTVTLDKEVTLADTKAYTLTVRLNDNTFETFGVSFAGTQTTDTITIESDFDVVPAQYDIYSIIENPYGINLFRITSISRKTDFTRSIKAVEYNESVVSDDPTVYPEPSHSELVLSPTISDVEITESTVVSNLGTAIPFLHIGWSGSDGVTESRVYISKNDGVTYELIATDLSTKFMDYNASGLTVNNTYYFKIIAKALGGEYTLLANATPYRHTFLGTNTAEEQSVIDRINTMLYDDGLIQKAITDGLVTVFTGIDAPVDMDYYDLWKRSVGDLPVSIYSPSSIELKGLSADDVIYMYYAEDNTWKLCTASQISFIDGILKQIDTEALADGKARVFTDIPTVPYDKGDVWIQANGQILASTTDRTDTYVALDWGIKPDYVAPTQVNENVTSISADIISAGVLNTSRINLDGAILEKDSNGKLNIINNSISKTYTGTIKFYTSASTDDETQQIITSITTTDYTKLSIVVIGTYHVYTDEDVTIEVRFGSVLIESYQITGSHGEFDVNASTAGAFAPGATTDDVVVEIIGKGAVDLTILVIATER